MPELYKRKPNTECLVCKKAIYRRPAILEANNGQVFCSSTCFGLHCRKEQPCIICGKLILASSHKKTCSRTCSNKYRVGIKYKIGRPRDKAQSERSIKIRLLEIRGKVCEKCSYNKQEILQVHHKDRDRSNNNLSNLELVCPNCHYEEHYLEKSWLKGKFGRVG